MQEDERARELGARAAATLALLHIESQRNDEGLRVAAEAVALAEGVPVLLARATTYLAYAQASCGQFEESIDTFERAWQVLPEDVLARWRVSYFRGIVEISAGRYDEAATRLEVARVETSAAGLGSCCTSAMEKLVLVRWAQGEWDDVARLSRELLHRPPSDNATVTAMIALLRRHVWLGELGEATSMAERLREALVTRWTVVTACDAAVALAELELARGDVAAAWQVLIRTWHDFDPIPDTGCREFIWATARALRLLESSGGSTAGLPCGDADPGEWLRNQVYSVRWTPTTPAWALLVDAELADGDAEAWASAVKALGAGTTPAHLSTYARGRWSEALQPPAPRRQPQPFRDPQFSALTQREREVLLLVAEGLTNGEIGRRLFISTKTASVHVSAILRKLGVATRTEAAVLATRG